MGENMDFSPLNKNRKEEQEFDKGAALASLSFSSVFSGFYFATFSLISFLATAVLCGIFYFGTVNTIRTTETMFQRYAGDLLTATAQTTTLAVKSRKFGSLSILMKNLKGEGIDDGTTLYPIDEMFYLDRKGNVLAHTDLTKATNSANSRVNKISSIYNNELFHTALMLSDGEMNVQPYPYQNFNNDRSYLYLIRFMLPRDYFETMDFSTPIRIGKQADGTLHLVMNRVYSDNLLRQRIPLFLIIWGASLFTAMIFALFIKIPVASRLRKINIFVKNYLSKDVEHYIENVEKRKIREEIEYIDQKISELTKKEQNVWLKSSGEKRQTEIRDALLIREN